MRQVAQLELQRVGSIRLTPGSSAEVMFPNGGGYLPVREQHEVAAVILEAAGPSPVPRPSPASPERTTFGQALGNGFAISALAGKSELMERGGPSSRR